MEEQLIQRSSTSGIPLRSCSTGFLRIGKYFSSNSASQDRATPDYSYVKAKVDCHRQPKDPSEVDSHSVCTRSVTSHHSVDYSYVKAKVNSKRPQGQTREHINNKDDGDQISEDPAEKLEQTEIVEHFAETMMSKDKRSSPIEKGDPWRQNILPPIRCPVSPPKHTTKLNHEDILVYGSLSEIDIYTSDMLMDDNGDSKFFDCDVCAKGYHRAVSPSYSKSATDCSAAAADSAVKTNLSNVKDSPNVDYVNDDGFGIAGHGEVPLDADSQMEDEPPLNARSPGSEINDEDYAATPQPEYDNSVIVQPASLGPASDLDRQVALSTGLLKPTSVQGGSMSRTTSHQISAPPSKANYNFDVEGLLIQLDRLLNHRVENETQRIREEAKIKSMNAWLHWQPSSTSTK